MKYFLLAGEASGDLHASHLMQQLSLRDPAAVFVGLGGDKMQAAGCTLRQHYRAMAYMGVFAVLRNLPAIRRNFRITYDALEEEKPDALILIDYPSFNLRVAEFCRKHLPRTRIYYYIPPKVWAWKSWRVHKIARLSDLVLGIFPFEPAFYAKYGYSCTYVGNPTQDCIREWKDTTFPPTLPQEGNTASGQAVCSHPVLSPNGKGNENNASITHYPSPINRSLDNALSGEGVIALLPGSRRSEIAKCLPTMLAAARQVVQVQPTPYRIVVAAAPSIEDAFYARYLHGETLTRDTYTLVSGARAAVVNSGTATLETALLGCPETAVYYIACSRWLEWLLRPIFFRTPFFTLVNIIPHTEVIQELIARRFTQANIEQELTRLLTDTTYRVRMQTAYAHISDLLGTTPAAVTASTAIISDLHTHNRH